MAVYRVTSGSCAGGNLVLTQIGCAVGGSTNGANVPSITLPTASLVANEVLYVRIDGQWQWARYEMNGRGVGYVIVDNERGYSLDKIQAIDYERR